MWEEGEENKGGTKLYPGIEGRETSAIQICPARAKEVFLTVTDLAAERRTGKGFNP